MKAEEVLDRLPEVRSMVDVPTVRAAAEHLLGAEAELHYAAFRLVNPGFARGFPPATACRCPQAACVGVTCIVAPCDFEEHNGSTAVVSGSHRWCRHTTGTNRSRSACSDEPAPCSCSTRCCCTVAPGTPPPGRGPPSKSSGTGADARTSSARNTPIRAHLKATDGIDIEQPAFTTRRYRAPP